MPEAATPTATEAAPAPPRAMAPPPAGVDPGGRAPGAGAGLASRPGVRVALLATLCGLFWGQVLLLASPERPPAQTLLLGLKAGLGAWVLLTLAGVAVALTRPRPAAGALVPAGRPATVLPLVVVAGTVLGIAALTFPATG